MRGGDDFGLEAGEEEDGDCGDFGEVFFCFPGLVAEGGEVAGWWEGAGGRGC